MNLFLIQAGLSEGVILSQMSYLINILNNDAHNNYLFLDSNYKAKLSNLSCSKLFYEDYIESIKSLSGVKNIYVRSYTVFVKLYFYRLTNSHDFKIIFDFRGLGSAETFARKKSYLKQFILLQLERFVFNRADVVHCVSNELKNFLIENFGEREVKVFPCCVSERIHKKQSSLSDGIKFVYVGGYSFWQKTQETINLYSFIEQKLENSTLTIITQDSKSFKRAVKDIGIKNVVIKSLDQREVLSDLKQYDFGFLLRDNILMNNVSSPIKFSEYISRGVFPILSEGVGDYSEAVCSDNLGIISKHSEFNIQLLYDLLHDKQSLDRLYEYSENIIWENHIENYKLSLRCVDK